MTQETEQLRLDIGDRIYKARVARGWSRVTLAGKIRDEKIAPKTIGRIEDNEACALMSVVPVLKMLGLKLVVVEIEQPGGGSVQ